MSDEPLQLTLDGGEVAMKDLTRPNCTNDETCTALADEHLPSCPVEQELYEDFGF